MRTLDRPLPQVGIDPAPIIAAWPVRPVIAIDAGDLPLVNWDDDQVLWNSLNVWDGDQIANAWFDASCAFTGLEIDTGLSDEQGLFPAARAVVQLDNRSGEWSSLNPDGTPARYGPGTAINIYAHNAYGDWWLFAGRIARYDQRTDDTIEIEAFDSFSDLAQPIGTYTPGANGQQPATRLNAILTAASLTALPHRFDIGGNTLTAQETEASPLEEMQAVAGSDGGLLFVDADGTMLYLDRTWRSGRTDQPAVPVASDNVCTADNIVWDATLSSNDDSLADYVVLENMTDLRAVAGTPPGYVINLSDQQWTTQTEGDILAQFTFDNQKDRQVKVQEFDLYLNDPNQPDLWRMVDLRRIDNLRFLHDQRAVGGGTLRVDVTTLIDGILHTITPGGGWMMSITTSKVMSATPPTFYDTGAEYNALPDPHEYGY